LIGTKLATFIENLP